VLSGRGLCDELITRPEEFYRLCCVVVCDLETSRMGAPYIYDMSRLRVNVEGTLWALELIKAPHYAAFFGLVLEPLSYPQILSAAPYLRNIYVQISLPGYIAQ